MYQTRSQTEFPLNWINLNQNTKEGLRTIAKELDITLPEKTDRDQIIRLIQQKTSRKAKPIKRSIVIAKAHIPIVDDDIEELIPELDEPFSNPVEDNEVKEEEEEEEEKPEDQMRFNIYSNIYNSGYSSSFHNSDDNDENDLMSYESSPEITEVSNTASFVLSPQRQTDIYIPQALSCNEEPKKNENEIKLEVIFPDPITKQVNHVNRLVPKYRKKSQNKKGKIIAIFVILFFAIRIIKFFVTHSIKMHDISSKDTYFGEANSLIKNGGFTKSQLKKSIPKLNYDLYKEKYHVKEDSNGHLSFNKHYELLNKVFWWGDNHPALSGALILLSTFVICFICAVLANNL